MVTGEISHIFFVVLLVAISEELIDIKLTIINAANEEGISPSGQSICHVVAK